MTVLRVRHGGNTANNAYYNARLLADAGIESVLPVQMFGLQHAMSAPAWEAIDFEVPAVSWVAQPDWSQVMGAVQVNAEFTDLPRPDHATGVSAPRGFDPRSLVMTVGRTVLTPLYGRRWAQPVFDASYRAVLARTSVLQPLPGVVDILYGADSQIRVKVPRPSPHLVCLEHGTVRWIADGGRETSVFRAAYRRQVQGATQLWVTNLDPRTLEIAEDVAPGRWSALPHPFVLDPRVPFATDTERRARLLAATGSGSLILLPSSQNWSATHDKGSKKALTAFVELRRAGVDVGLVAVEWGLQLAESKAFLQDAGVAENVSWVAPMARFGLQRMMADVDVVWDQFGLDAFGALALRATEQGTPLVSRGLAPEGERLIGGPVPWLHATSVDDIVRETRRVLDDMAVRGRDEVIADYRRVYRTWLSERHSARMTADLQREVYARIVDGTFEPGDSAPDAWARWLDRDGRTKGESR